MEKKSIVKISRTKILVRVSANVPQGIYYGSTTHFAIDTNTQEYLSRAFREWTVNGNIEDFIQQMEILKPNLETVMNNYDK